MAVGTMRVCCPENCVMRLPWSMTVCHRLPNENVLLIQRLRGPDEFSFGKADSWNPLRIGRTVEQDEVGLLVGGDGFRVWCPESWIFVRRRGKYNIYVFAADSISKVLQWIVYRVDGHGSRTRYARGFLHIWAATSNQ